MYYSTINEVIVLINEVIEVIIYVSKKTNSLNDNYPNINSNVLYPLSIIAKSKGFRIARLNVNSLLKHIDEIRVILEKNPLDILL